uniref:Sushi, von Willebrand factor type A, EGF and pentraxin domain-containing protein 1 n=1 Tax=Ciona savignyi TaxID=51511 RepID=H2Z1V1_CIOSA
MASEPKADHVYILNSFADFEALARRALHADAEGGDYITEEDHHCHKYCSEGGCCDPLGKCRCGTTTGLYECVCDPGFWGFGLLPDGCTPCPGGTYKPFPSPGGLESCSPCPDPNMVSPNASSDVNQCTCKLGFRQVGQACEVTRCPVLHAPLNGRFTGVSCDNRYKARCGFTCDHGYDLVGSGSIKCGIDGNWVTTDEGVFQEAFCQVRYCPPLPSISNGGVELHGPLTILIRPSVRQHAVEGFCPCGGLPERSCQGRVNDWGAEEERPIRCQSPVAPPGASLNSNCAAAERKLEYGHMCTFTCPLGFALNMANSFFCVRPDEWSEDISAARCIDIEPPTITCPNSIEAFASPQIDSAVVTWEVPVPYDNSGQVSLSSTPAVHPPAAFHIGTLLVTYTAVDGAGLPAECSFRVSIIDNQAPLISECNNPPPFVIPRNQFIAHNVSWREPTFSDNSGRSHRTVFMNRSHDFGDMPFGQTRVQYIASDATGNSRSCVIVVSVQDMWCNLISSTRPCHPISCDRICEFTLKFLDRYGIAMQTFHDPFHVCEDDGQWHPALKIPIDCSYQRYADELVKGYRVSYRLETINSCNDTAFLESQSSDCWITEANMLLNAVETFLHENNQNKYLFRSILSTVNYFYLSPGGRGDNEPNPPDAYDAYDTETEPTPVDYEDESIPISPGLNSFQYTEEEAFALTKELGRTVDTLEITITIKAVRHINTSVTTFVTYEDGSYVSSGNELQCPLGTVLRAAATFNCPIGTYYDVSLIECISCPVGFYQDDEAQLSCKACPLHTSTPGNHTRSLEECKNLCSLGTYSFNGLEVCVACDKHTYADVYGSTECTTCPPDTGTPSRGTTSYMQCGQLCNIGYASLTGIEPCYPCPANTYQPERATHFCYKCPLGSYTISTGTTDRLDCIDFSSLSCSVNWSIETPASLVGSQHLKESNPSNSTPFNFTEPCDNEGTCEPSPAGFICICQAGYVGTNCETNFDECASNPCENGGVCSDLINQYSCECALGYEGETCSVETDECASNPCEHGATCVDLLASFSCECGAGYAGELCEIDINECEGSPCANGAECLDLVGRYECVCTPGYAGERCYVDIDECSSDPCQNGATCSDHVNGFTCECEVGYEGTFCQINHDDCADVHEPCTNGGTCVDMTNSYRCVCAPSFAGDACETELDPDFDLLFGRANTYHHVHMKEGIRNMTEVTVAFYVKSNHTESEGTPFSYGIGKGPLADVLTLTNLAALTLYVNGESVVTDARKINDDQWYHVVVTWKSEGGEWAIYLNHFREVGGTGLQEGTVIPGGG